MKRLNVFMLSIFLSACMQYGFSTAMAQSAPAAGGKATTGAKAEKKSKVSKVSEDVSTQAAETESTTEQVAAPETPADLKKLGDQLTKKGKAQEAFEAYKKCVDDAGDDSLYSREAHIVAKKLYSEKMYKEALPYFQKVSGRATSKYLFRTMYGTTLQRNGQNDSAIAIMKSAASNRKVSIKARKKMFSVLGDAYVAVEKPELAVGWYGMHLKTGGAKTADMLFLIASEKAKVAPAKAPALYQSNIKNFPEDYRNYLHLGIFYSSNPATLEKSVKLLKKTVSLVDSLPQAWMELGKTYQRLQKNEEAQDAYGKCLEKDGSNMRARMLLGELLINSGKTDKAISCLETAHKQAPDSAAPLALLSMAYTRGGKAKKAVAMLEKLKSVSPDDAAVKRQLFEAYQNAGNDKKALDEITDLLTTDRDRETLYPYALLLTKMKQYDEAAVALEEILGTYYDDFESLMLLASVYRKQKRLNEAVNVYKQVCSLDSKYAPALYQRAEVHMEQEKIKWAEMFYKRSLSADPQMALAEVGLAKVAVLYKNRSQCELHLSNAQRIAADDPAVQKAIEDVRNPPKAVVQSSVSKKEVAAADIDDSGDKKKKKKKRRKKKK